MPDTLIGADAAVRQLEGWSVSPGERDCIKKTYRFEDFNAAFAWMTQVARKADEMDHHPEWFNVYDRVDVTLCTHSAAGVTGLDVALARFMDEAAPKPGA